MKKLVFKILLFLGYVISLTAGLFYLVKVKQSLIELPKFVGATIRPYALSRQNPSPNTRQPNPFEQVDEQLKTIKELGGNAFRFNDEHNYQLDRYIVQQAQALDLTPVMVLEPIPSINFNTHQDYYLLGYQYARQVAQAVPGIGYYQLLNEVSGTAVTKPGDQGPTLPNRFNLTYNRRRYERVRDYLKGLSVGLKETVPTAKRIVTAHWVLIDIFQYLMEDGVEFEIIAWDWYSDQGLDIHNRIIDEGGSLDVAGTVIGWGKQFWLVEVNRDGGSFGGQEQQQAAFIAEFMARVLPDETVGAVFIHMLPDMAHNPKDPANHLGLVTLDLKNHRLGPVKPAYLELKQSIADYQNNRRSKSLAGKIISLPPIAPLINWLTPTAN